MEVKKILLVLCLCVIFASTVSSKAKSKTDNEEDTYGELDDENVQKDDNNYEDNIEDGNNIVEEENEPRVQEGTVEFKTQPQIFIGNIGDTIRMPCAVSNPDIVNIWQKDETILYQDHSPLAKYPNILELNFDHTLEVNITSDADYGSYTCELIIKNDNNPKIVHRLMRPTPPVITGILTENNKTEYAAGETLRLTCVASGLPKPIISWHKGSERLELTGETITIPNLSESDGGTYRCLADNHVQKPSHHHIVIYITHAPKITIGQYLVTSNKEKDTELVCTVDAYPAAHPIWKRGSQPIQNDGNKKIVTKRREHTIESILVISSLSDEDFTNYTCFAKNSLGRSEKVVSLVKIPAVREFVKPEKNLRDVVLSWKVESKSPIEAHEIQYRKKGDQAWRTAVPEVTNADKDIYTVKYTLKDLDVGSYETRLRSKNEHGWSEFSEIMPFEGVLAKHGSSAHKNQHKKHHKEKELKEKHIVQDSTSAPQQQEISQKEAPVGESKPQGSSSGKVSASATILSIASIFLFYIRQ